MRTEHVPVEACAAKVVHLLGRGLGFAVVLSTSQHQERRITWFAVSAG